MPYLFFSFAFFFPLFLSSIKAYATQPLPWQKGFQAPGSYLMETVTWFNALTLWISAAVVGLVFCLLIWCIVRYRARRNPAPSKRTHHVGLEVTWTIIPVLILLVIAVPSFRLLYNVNVVPAAALTVKATGYQWYWGYAYPDEAMGDLSFDSVMLNDEEREKRMQEEGVDAKAVPRLLATDVPLVVPVGKVVRLQVTAADVIHSFAMPSLGVKMDAVPGRLNETWFKVDHPGAYYGQCSELCGIRHAYMPIELYALPEKDFLEWSRLAQDDLKKAQAYAFRRVVMSSASGLSPPGH